MLSRANNASIRFERVFVPASWAEVLRFWRKRTPRASMGRWWIRIGRKEYPDGVVPEEAFLEEAQQQRHAQILMMAVDERWYWWFQDRFYWENDNMDGDDVHALLLTRHQRERQRIERARATVAMGEEPRIRWTWCPEFAMWCGTNLTADWHRRFSVHTMVYGHLHIPRTTFHEGVRFEEVSVGYPREWSKRAQRPGRLRRILPKEGEKR